MKDSDLKKEKLKKGALAAGIAVGASGATAGLAYAAANVMSDYQPDDQEEMPIDASDELAQAFEQDSPSEAEYEESAQDSYAPADDESFFVAAPIEEPAAPAPAPTPAPTPVQAAPASAPGVQPEPEPFEIDDDGYDSMETDAPDSELEAEADFDFSPDALAGASASAIDLAEDNIVDLTSNTLSNMYLASYEDADETEIETEAEFMDEDCAELPIDTELDEEYEIDDDELDLSSFDDPNI